MALPSTSQLYEDFYYWIDEREAVRLRREVEKLPKPWSTDPIFQTVRFCNIRREDDKVTKWIASNWREPHSTSNNLAFSMCLARIVNWPPTLEQLGFPSQWHPTHFVAKMTALSGGGSNKIWGGAYMVTGGYSAGGETKQVIMARVLEDAFRRTRPGTLSLNSLTSAFDDISQTKGLGTFLSAQVIADLKYTPLLQHAVDWWEFCAPGPGSTMGLNFLANRPPTQAIDEARFTYEVNRLFDPIFEGTGYRLTAHDIQNCLCEFSKYVRIKYLGGRAKTSFRGW